MLQYTHALETSGAMWSQVLIIVEINWLTSYSRFTESNKLVTPKDVRAASLLLIFRFACSASGGANGSDRPPKLVVLPGNSHGSQLEKIHKKSSINILMCHQFVTFGKPPIKMGILTFLHLFYSKEYFYVHCRLRDNPGKMSCMLPLRPKPGKFKFMK